jgi:hypothetical protein
LAIHGEIDILHGTSVSFSDPMNLRIRQYAVTIAGGLFAGALLLYKDGFRKEQLDIFSSFLVVSVLITDLWLEVRQLHEAQEDILKNTASQLVEIDRELLDNKDYLEATSILLKHYRGICSRKRLHILKKAHREFTNQYRIVYEGKRDEFERIDVLSEVITHSDKYVWAYTFASAEYLRGFWENHRNQAIDIYFRAHKQALTRRRNIRRVFVIPNDLHETDRKAGAILINVISRLFREGMEDIYVILGTEAEEAFRQHGRPFPRRSFLVADDCFVSEGEGIDSAEEKQSSYCLFTERSDDCREFKNAFGVLESKAGHPLRKSEFDKLQQQFRGGST